MVIGVLILYAVYKNPEEIVSAVPLLMNDTEHQKHVNKGEAGLRGIANNCQRFNV